MITPKIVNIKDNLIWIYDAGKVSLFAYNREDFISSHNPEIDQTVKLRGFVNKIQMSENVIVAARIGSSGLQI
jgi:hypothetical protein